LLLQIENESELKWKKDGVEIENGNRGEMKKKMER
jgi:hypothetical protein